MTWALDLVVIHFFLNWDKVIRMHEVAYAKVPLNRNEVWQGKLK